MIEKIKGDQFPRRHILMNWGNNEISLRYQMHERNYDLIIKFYSNQPIWCEHIFAKGQNMSIYVFIIKKLKTNNSTHHIIYTNNAFKLHAVPFS